MISPALEIQRRLDEIDVFLAEQVPESTTIRRRFDYASVITISYAVFEVFAERLCAAGVTAMAAHLPYSDLDERLRTKHLTRSAELLRARLGEGRYAALTPELVISNLNSCVNGIEQYTLTEEAIIAHDLNLRFDELNRLFSEAGVQDIGALACSHGAMLEWYRRAYDDLATAVPAEVLRSALDDLVERRNELAHRGTADNLLSNELLTTMVDFLRSLAIAMTARVVGTYLSARMSAGMASAQLELLEGPYRDGRVVVVAPPAAGLQVGGPVFRLGSRGLADWGTIESLQTAGEDVESIPPGATVPDVGVGLSFQYRSGSLFIPLQNDPLLWP